MIKKLEKLAIELNKFGEEDPAEFYLQKVKQLQGTEHFTG